MRQALVFGHFHLTYARSSFTANVCRNTKQNTTTLNLLRKRISCRKRGFLGRVFAADSQALLSGTVSLYGNCMARLISTTIRLDQEDVRALKRARAAGHSASELIRKGLRVVASRYYSGRRPPSTRLFESTDQKLGDESELFRNLEQ